MRIIHSVLSQQFYGSERHCIELATAQALAGHKVFILVQGGKSYCTLQFRQMISATLGSEPSGETVRLIEIPDWLPAAFHRPFAWLVLKVLRPDIVHTHLNSATRRIGSVALRLGITHITTLHIRYDHREHRFCDGLICGASWQRAGIPPDFAGKVAVVWAWLPVAAHQAMLRVTSEEVCEIRLRWSADEQTIVFGSIGRLFPEKGMDVLVQAFRKAFPSGNEPVRLIIVGLGPGEDELRRAAETDRRIELITVQGEIAPLYRALDVYVSAARFEPFGLTILEAMDAGCPLIVTRTQGPNEFLRDERALWAEVGDVGTLAEQLGISARGGRRRYAYDLTPFSSKSAVKAIEEFYRDVARQS